ncbi:hypothetical protein ES702_04907 [subsurface metagenome]
MSILRMIKTLITVKGLEVLLLGKEVTMPDGVGLGVVVAIEKELAQDRIWMVVDNQGREKAMPIEQIASVTNKVTLFGDLSLSRVAMNGD